jgi:uracil-DNA glycosylase family 4
MQPHGEGKKRILIIAEAPGEDEDIYGKQLIGKAGKYLERHLNANGIQLHIDCRKINAVNCRPPDNKTPTSKQISYCRPMVWREIQEYKPKVIFLLGGSAVESFLGHRWKKDLDGINKWRGWAIPDRDVTAWVFPIFHPSYAMRGTTPHSHVNLFRKDLRMACSYTEKSLPPCNDEIEGIHILTDTNKIIHILEEVNRINPKLMAFDYETTGLKPHKEGHEIVCCSLSHSMDEAYSFPITNKIIPYLKKVLENRKIGKIASNLGFETIWSNVILNIDPKNWIWDTALAAHIQDNRPRIASLKFQSYVRYGIVDYDSKISPFLISEYSNDFNRVKEVPLEDLLVYCGMDSLLEYRLARDQMKEMGYAWNK